MNPGQQMEFHASCGHLISAPADRAGQDARCPHCHRVVRVPGSDVPYASPVPLPAGATEPMALTALYMIALIAGLAGAGLVYMVMFDSLSESELVTLTPLWFFPIVFGLYGFVSQRLLRRIASGRAGTLHEAARLSIDVAGHWAALVLFPFLVLKWRSSLLVSLAAALFWAVLLWLFFTAVFPTL
ncbi:hypothetical protein E2C00_03695 [Streptomyces sp. WAC05374]|nr:hypothetical protein EF905_03125 [Streptomyces sp. WAC05374]TDF50588.1 hypothetical protein E2B92_03680 [Streptomyces sp. WAC05374]TDF56877.1 hypothetical protein E2C02_10490 [Streptomyces sp. WAC05374]TDF60840.1 hypothetical protein E2C00_03695 [Streptomyces sp. WAC05374]